MMNTKTMEQFTILDTEMLATVEGGTVKEFFYAIGLGAAAGAGFGATVCAPTVAGAAPCALLGSFYGIAAGGFGYALDHRRK